MKVKNQNEIRVLLANMLARLWKQIMFFITTIKIEIMNSQFTKIDIFCVDIQLTEEDNYSITGMS